MSARPEPFGIGHDGVQWEERGAPSGFRVCPMKARPVGEPSPYPSFIEPQQGICPTTPARYVMNQGVCVRSTGSAWDVRLCAGDNPTPTKPLAKTPTKTITKKGVKGTPALQIKAPTPVKTGYVAPQPDYITKGLSILESISSSLQRISATLEPKPANIVVEPNTPTSVSAYGGRRIVSSKQNKRGKKTRRTK